MDKPKKRERKDYQAAYRQKGKEKEINPEAVRKGKQYQRDSILRFHARRAYLGIAPLPESVKNNPRYLRALELYKREIAEKTIVDIVS